SARPARPPRRARPLRDRRSDAEGRAVALRGADRRCRRATALGARLPPVPLQLRERRPGPLARRELPPAPDPLRRAVARHPPPRGLPPAALEPREVPRSG